MQRMLLYADTSQPWVLYSSREMTNVKSLHLMSAGNESFLATFQDSRSTAKLSQTRFRHSVSCHREEASPQSTHTRQIYSIAQQTGGICHGPCYQWCLHQCQSSCCPQAHRYGSQLHFDSCTPLLNLAKILFWWRMSKKLRFAEQHVKIDVNCTWYFLTHLSKAISNFRKLPSSPDL